MYTSTIRKWAGPAALVAALAFVGSCGGDDGDAGQTGRCKIETTEAESGGDLVGVWGEAAGDVFVVGPGGDVLQLTESGWPQVETGLPGVLYDIWGGPDGEWFAVGCDLETSTSVIGHYDGAQWAEMTHPHPHPEYDEELTGVWGSAADDVWAVGQGGGYRILRFDGTQWIVVWESDQELTKIWGSGPDFVVATGGSSLLIYDGTEWSPLAVELPSPACAGTINAAWGTGPDHFYVVGRACGEDFDLNHPLIAEYEGGEWNALVHQDPDYDETVGSGLFAAMNDVWGLATDVIFAVGDDYSYLIEGDQITMIEPSSLSVWGRSLAEIFAVGALGQIHEIDCSG